MKRRFFIVLLGLLLLLPTVSPVIRAENASVEVEGLITRFNPEKGDNLSMTVQVKGEASREVELQYYNPQTERWMSLKSFLPEGEKVTVTFPKNWQYKTTSIWRLAIPEEDYYSPEITVTTKNCRSLELDSPYAAIMRESDGAWLYGKQEDVPHPNASTTKLMTALLTLENTEPEDIITVSAEGAATPYGVMYLSEGQRFYRKDLLDCLLIRSCNDAAAVLAEHIGGSQEAFVEMMNQKAADLGLEHTQYKNPHGLYEEGHYSCPEDLCRLMQVCYRDERFRKTIGRRSCFFYDVDLLNWYYFETTDLLLYHDIAQKGFKGGKTGYVEEAGECFVGVFEKDGETYYFASLGASDKPTRWKDVLQLIHYIQKYA